MDSADAAEITGGIFNCLIVFLRKNEIPGSVPKLGLVFDRDTI